MKAIRPPLFSQLIDKLAEDARSSGLLAVLGSDVSLIPVPRSAPLVAGGLWPAGTLCEALVAVGLGAEVLPILTRTKSVQKSAFAAPGGRPTPRAHYETIAAEPCVPAGTRVVVVDDFVTKGATFLASSWRVHEIMPAVEISAFAMVRTMGLVPDVDRLIAPHVGRIIGSMGNADRRD